eukprot:g2371.t1
MSNRYDKQTTTFNTAGRLFQVEYAIEATKNAGPALGILGKDCVALVGEKKTSSKLLDQAKQPEKIFEIDDHICCAVAGLTSDANTLIQKLRLYAQQYLYRYGEPIPVEQLVVHLCDFKQGYTQFGGLRPFGVSFLFAGYDKHFGFQLYQSDPAGKYDGWRAHSIGSWDNPMTNSTLKQDWSDGMERSAVKELIGKVMIKNGDTTTPDPEKYEMAMVTKDPSTGKVKYARVAAKDVEKILTAARAKEDAEQQAKGTGN